MYNDDMKALREKYKNLISTLSCSLKPFFYGQLYLVLISLSSILAYALNQSFFGITILCICGVLTLLLFDDLTPFVPLCMLFMLNLKSWDLFLTPAPYILLSLVGLSLIFHFILFPKKFKKGSLFLSIIIVSISLLLSGLFADGIFTYYHKGLVSRIGTGPIILLVYLVFTNGINPPKNFDITKYFCIGLVLLGLVCYADLFVNDYLFEKEVEGIVTFDIGWNNVNGVASLLLLTIPAGFYLLVNSKRMLLWAIVIAFLYRAMYLTGSDGCLGVSMVAFPILCVYAFIYANKKLRFYLLCLGCLAVAVGCLIVTLSLIETGTLPIVDKIKDNLFVDSGRTQIYKTALELFAKYPVFGVGIGYAPEDATLGTSLILAYNFHSTFFHVIATMGVVGLIAYIYYFYKRYRLLMRHHREFNTFMVVAFTIMEVYGMIDTCEFNIMPLMFIVTILLVIVEHHNEIEYLPLKKDKRFACLFNLLSSIYNVSGN